MEVVEKVWGREEIIVNADYCGKRMLLKKGYRCSIHMHKTKDETFFVTKGSMQVLLIGRDFELSKADGSLGYTREMAPLYTMGSPVKPESQVVIMVCGDILRIKPGTWHCFTGLEDTEFFEFSTHHEDSDTVRRTVSGKIDELPR